MIIIYSKPDCIQCEYTKRKLVERGLQYKEIDVTQDEVAAKHLADLGVSALPYVITDRDRWSGFKIDKIRGIRK